MKYEICKMGFIDLESRLCGNDECSNTFNRRHSVLDTESSLTKLIHQVNYKINHIPYSIFHISKRLKGAL